MPAQKKTKEKQLRKQDGLQRDLFRYLYKKEDQ